MQKNILYKILFLITFFSCGLLHAQKKEISIALDSLNTLYLGIENKICILAPGISPENLNVKISSGSIEGKNGKYIVKTLKRGSVTLDIYDVNTLVESKQLICKVIPRPLSYLGDLTGDCNSTREDLIKAECLNVRIPNFPYTFEFKVVSFTLAIGLKKEGRVSVYVDLTSNNGCLTETMKKYIMKPDIGSTIYFEDIKVETPNDGIRKVPGITVRLNSEIMKELKDEKDNVIEQKAKVAFSQKQLQGQVDKMKEQSAVLEEQNRLMFEKKKEMVVLESNILKQKNVLGGQVVMIQNQKTLLGISIFVIIIVVFLMAFSIRSYLKKRQANLKLEEQNVIIAEKNHEITDSINYAQRIQRSILPPLVEVKAALPNSFILFKPKDIISGDFYWFAEADNKILIAACDCTGHGVPGAFMSTIGSEKLNEAVKDSADVSTILNLVNRGMKKVLRQSEKADSTRDGMDIALCAFNKEMTKVEYSGANRPLWIVRKGIEEIEETKATKVAIGGYTEDEQVFAKHEIDLQKGDTVYIFSDGYADQFSPQDKKLMTRKFKEIILSIQNKSMEEQREYLGSFIENWKGNMEQTDDILVIGVRV